MSGLDLGDLESLADDNAVEKSAAPENNAPDSPEEAAPAIVVPQLTEAEKRKIEAEARKEVEKEQHKKAAAEYKEHIKKQLETQMRAAANIAEDGEGIEEIRIELAKYTMYIMLDGKVFYHGYTYKFGKKQAAVIKEQIYRSWLHDAEIHGLDINEMNGRKKHMSMLAPSQRR
jgi:hypothetical protein